MTTPNQSFRRLGNLRGPKGDAGAKGDPGAAGSRGPGWVQTALTTPGTVPDQPGTIVGDLLLDTATGDYYVREA